MAVKAYLGDAKAKEVYLDKYFNMLHKKNLSSYI